MAGKRLSVSTRTGFTLLELLVVILIVAVAVAVLFPVFNSVRERGRESVCLTHVSQHARAVLMYTQDYDDRLPLGANPPPLGAPDEESLYPRWWSVVEPYLKNKDVLRCLDDAGYMGMRPGDPLNDEPFYPTAGSSYSSLLGWLPTSDPALALMLPQMPGGLGGLSLAAIADPTLAALTFDSWPYWHSESRDPRLATTTDAVTMNVSYLDGSARRSSFRSVAGYLAYGPAVADGSRRLALGDLPPVSPGGGRPPAPAANPGVVRPAASASDDGRIANTGSKTPSAGIPLDTTAGSGGKVRTASEGEDESDEDEEEKKKKKKKKK